VDVRAGRDFQRLTMPSLETIQDVVAARLCISCGACAAVTDDASLQMHLDEKRGLFIPRRSGRTLGGTGREFAVCPGKGIPLEAMSAARFGADLPTSPELGRYRRAWACHTADEEILARASSGGVMTHIACRLLESGVIDGVTVAKFVQGPLGPRTISVVARSRAELLDAQGSKYCPTTTNLLMRECRRAGGRYLFLGTPCQVAALHLAMREDDGLAAVFPLTMANFCGGYKDFRYLDGMIAASGLRASEASNFRFRGGGWPGSMLVACADGREASQPYPNYRSTALVSKQRRCTLCVDGTGLLADFACGDAWLERFEPGTPGWSIVLARSAAAVDIVESMRRDGLLHTEPVSHDEILHSQRFNLRSKISRQRTRMKAFRLLGIPCPVYDVDLPPGVTSLWQEFRVLALKTWPMLYLRVRFRETTMGELVARGVRLVRSLRRPRGSKGTPAC
jgi:coenzyme F420 hydrogenase subunit beta